MRKQEQAAAERTAKRAKLATDAERYRNEHPEILESLIFVLRDAKEWGWEEYSVYAAWETVRYWMPPKPKSMNNRYRKFFARWVLEAAPELRGFVRTR